MNKDVLHGEIVRIGEQNLTMPIREVKEKDEVLKYLDKEFIVQKLGEIKGNQPTVPRDHMFLTFLWMTGL